MQDCQACTTGTRLPPALLPAFPIAPAQAQTFQPALTRTPVQHTCKTMAGVAATSPNPSVPGFPGIFSLLEDEANTNPRSRLERLAILPLGEMPPLVVCLEAPAPHIRVLWDDQFVTPPFLQPT